MTFVSHGMHIKILHTKVVLINSCRHVDMSPIDKGTHRHTLMGLTGTYWGQTDQL